MITADIFNKRGISSEDEKTPLDILENMAMSTREIASKLTECLPEGDVISFSCAKQKMIRLEKKGLVTRKKVKGLIHWIKVSSE